MDGDQVGWHHVRGSGHDACGALGESHQEQAVPADEGRDDVAVVVDELPSLGHVGAGVFDVADVVDLAGELPDGGGSEIDTGRTGQVVQHDGNLDGVGDGPEVLQGFGEGEGFVGGGDDHQHRGSGGLGVPGQ